MRALFLVIIAAFALVGCGREETAETFKITIACDASNACAASAPEACTSQIAELEQSLNGEVSVNGPASPYARNLAGRLEGERSALQAWKDQCGV